MVNKKSLLLLLFTNLFVIFLAIIENWDIITLAIIYWAQSVIVGTFTFLKIKNLKDFKTEGFKINNMPAEILVKTKGKDYVRNFTANFFLFHYGFFHLGYIIFLLQQAVFSSLNLFTIFLGVGVFLIDHTYSYFQNKENDSKKMESKNIGYIMFLPYLRIIPMHLSIVIGIFLVQSTPSLIFFLGLKTIADIVMHALEHKV